MNEREIKWTCAKSSKEHKNQNLFEIIFKKGCANYFSRGLRKTKFSLGTDWPFPKQIR